MTGLLKDAIIHTSQQGFDMKKTLIVALMMVAGIAQAQQDCSLIIPPTLEVASNVLKDPMSAQFRNIKIYSPYVDTKGVVHTDQYLAAGEVNGKNSFGGYVGFAKFAVRMRFVDQRPVSQVMFGKRGSVQEMLAENIINTAIVDSQVICSQ